MTEQTTTLPILTVPPPPKPLTKEGFQVSNAILLGRRAWVALLLLALGVVLGAPRIWERIEKFNPAPDYRIPYELANDYWHYERLARQAAARQSVALFGDSVIWGQYVTSGGTLSHYLNAQTASTRFANLGLDGAHPTALAGLIDYHAGAIRNQKTIIQCNLLWLSSPKHDLSEREEFNFNHPALVPQFFPRIPCYREEVSRRLGYILERNFPFYTWVNHIQLSRYGQASIPEWTLDHPYDYPFKPLATAPKLEDKPHEEPKPWTERAITPQDFAWVGLERSLQWQSFRRAVEVLRGRGNQVLVVVGPFNLHLANAPSQAVYKDHTRRIAEYFGKLGVACVVPETLPSNLYADASHPLAEGYETLAQRLLQDPVFKTFVR